MFRCHVPRWLTLLCGVVCAVWVALVPRAAFASGATCDASAAGVELPGPLACVEIAVIAGVAEEDVAGFCDLRGATGIAPRPALQGSDGVLDVGPGCSPEIRAGAHLDRRDAPPPLAIDAAAIDRVAPSPVARVAPSSLSAEVIFADDDAYALPRGFRRGVEHPPRALAHQSARVPRVRSSSEPLRARSPRRRRAPAHVCEHLKLALLLSRISPPSRPFARGGGGGTSRSTFAVFFSSQGRK